MYLKQIAAYVPKNEQEKKADKRIIYHYCKEHPHNVLTRQNEVAHLTSSGFIMNKDLTRVLVIYHKIYEAWGWTGGHVDGDTDLLKVALKEAEEETGLTRLRPLSEHIMSMDILPVWGHVKGDGYVSAHLHYNVAYILIANEEDPLVMNEIETGGVKWIDADAIDQHSDEPDLVAVYHKLIEAARNYDSTKEVPIEDDVADDEYGSITTAIKETAIPIALHETQSAYYKAKLAKEVVVRSGKVLHKNSRYLFKRFKK